MAQQSVITKNRNVPLDKIRNVGIIAHIDSGKTTTTERFLFYTGRTYKIGDIDEGNTQMDWMPQERERGITIMSAATTTFWKGVRINIIDTPGHVDFTAEVERSLRVLDGGVVIFDAEEGVQSQSETVWRQADKYRVPRICFINKMDKLGADFEATVGEIRDRLGAHPVIMTYPIGKEQEFRGVIDLLTMEAKYWEKDPQGIEFVTSKEIPADLQETVAKARAKLIEQIAETDDKLLDKYLNGNEISVDELKKTLRAAVIAYKLIPVYCGTSLRNKAVQPVLDAVVDYLPSPLDLKEISGQDPKTGEVVKRKLTPEEKFSALAFKIQLDPHVGKLTYTRVYSGVLESGSYVYNVNRDRQERVSRVLLMHANNREEIDKATPETLSLWSVQKTLARVIPWPINPLPLSWKKLLFRNRSFLWQSNRRRRPIRKNYLIPCKDWPKKTRLSKSKLITRPVRRLCLVWASFIWKFSSTG